MLRLKSLGECAIEAGDTNVPPAAETIFALALYLILEAGRAVGRDELGPLLWPHVSEAQAQHGLRQALYRLRSFGVEIATQRSALMLPPECCTTDFVELLAPQTLAAQEALADRINGTFLPGYRPQLSEAFATWVERKRDVVHSAVARTLMGGMQAKKRVSDWSRAEKLAQMCLSIDPLNEEATLTVAEAAALGGSKTKALSILNHYLEDIGEGAGEIKLPAVLLRRRISEAYRDNVFPVRDAPFVGREAEMAELTRALAKAQSGHGSAYVITGEPGIGKTRLLSEFTRVAALQRLHIVRVGCQSHDVRRPLSVFVDLVPKLLALPGALGCSPESMQYLRRLVSHDPEEMKNRDQVEQPGIAYESARRGILDVLDAVTAERSVLLEIEDAQWLDAHSFRLAEELSNWLGTRRLLLVMTSRSSELTRENISRMQLRPLASKAGSVVARALVEATIVERDDFINWCVLSSGGNPYYLIELLRDGRRERGQYSPSETLTRLLQNRVQVLGRDARGILEVCCILGKHSTMARLESCMEISRPSLLRALEELDAGGMIDTDESRVVSKHDLLSSVVLSQMSGAVKVMLHRFAAERLGSEAESSQAVGLLWESAEHWLLASDTPRAVELLRRCGNHLMDVGMPEEAAGVLARAESLATESSVIYAIGAEQARALMRAELFTEGIELTERLILLREAIYPRPWILDEVGLLRIQAIWRHGGSVRELALEYVPSLSTTSVPCDEVVAAAGWLLTAADNICEPEIAHDIYGRVAGCLSSCDVMADTRLLFEMVYHCAFGNKSLAIPLANQLVEHASNNCSPIPTIKYLRFAAYVHLTHGTLNRAITLASESYTLSERMRAYSAMSSSAGMLGAIYLQTGDLVNADRWLSRAAGDSDSAQNKVLDSNNWSYLTELAIRKKESAAAEQYLSRSVPILATSHTSRGETRRWALKSQLGLLRGERLDLDELDSFIAAFDKSKSACTQDFNAESLLLALEAAGRIDDAAKLASEYLTKFRRDSAAITSYLRNVTMRLGIPSRQIAG